ncbi:hypothetical protein BE08_37855 [Sorangium cellulosum]|uniref:Uncharacterized protein n=1 Tax=Sorangium cellulosum TaxID=56 RepID=A0A150PR55_SORCE|nr:hypothetical protein BE08_37855 [Sorangium cellulosum]
MKGGDRRRRRQRPVDRRERRGHGGRARGVQRRARQRLGDLRATLERNPEEARRALETILGGALRFTPIGDFIMQRRELLSTLERGGQLRARAAAVALLPDEADASLLAAAFREGAMGAYAPPAVVEELARREDGRSAFDRTWPRSSRRSGLPVLRCRRAPVKSPRRPGWYAIA